MITFRSNDNVMLIFSISILNLSNSCSRTTVLGVKSFWYNFLTLLMTNKSGTFDNMSSAAESIISSRLTPTPTDSKNFELNVI